MQVTAPNGINRDLIKDAALPSADHGSNSSPATNITVVPNCLPQAATESTLKAIGELATGAASLMWPIVALILFLLFKKEVVGLLTRIKKGKIGAAEFELDDVIQKLESKAAEIKEESALSNDAPQVADPGVSITETRTALGGVSSKTHGGDVSPSLDDIASAQEDSDNALQLISEVQAVLQYSPKAALVLMASSMEAKIRQILKSVAGKEAVSPLLRKNVRTLQEKNVISEELTEGIFLFWKTRNLVLHAQGRLSKSNVQTAIDAGREILLSLVDIQAKVLDRLSERYRSPQS